MDLETLRYPIGRASEYVANNGNDREDWLRTIGETPAEVRLVVEGLTDEQLDTPYRPAGWTVRQVVHHYADDHLNSYTRFKLALTEEAPTIKGYGEALWAELPDARLGPIEPSLNLLTALHHRWMDAIIHPHTWTALIGGVAPTPPGAASLPSNNASTTAKIIFAHTNASLQRRRCRLESGIAGEWVGQLARFQEPRN